jgi:phosphomannomutase
MVKTGKKPSQLLEMLFEKVGAHYYDRIDTRCTPAERDAVKEKVLNAKPVTIGGLKVTALDTTDGFKFVLGEDGWVLIRLSGTEPIVRVYTETTHGDKVQAILQDGLKIAGLR